LALFLAGPSFCRPEPAPTLLPDEREREAHQRHQPLPRGGGGPGQRGTFLYGMEVQKISHELFSKIGNPPGVGWVGGWVRPDPLPPELSIPYHQFSRPQWNFFSVRKCNINFVVVSGGLHGLSGAVSHESPTRPFDHLIRFWRPSLQYISQARNSCFKMRLLR